MLYDYFKTVVDNIEVGDVVVYNLPNKYGEPTYWMVMETDFEDNTIYGKEVKHDCLASFSYVPESEALQSRWISIADLDLKSTIVLNKYKAKESYEQSEEQPLLDVVLKGIDLTDIVLYDGVYWKVLKIDFIKETVYCKQVIREEKNGHVYYRDAHTDEELMPRWINIKDLDLVPTITINDYYIADSELEETVDIMTSEPNREEQTEFDAMVYHVEYNLDYARGLSLKDILPSEIIKFEGNIVSKGKVWVFQTTMGCVIIPFESIIHMHPQY